MTTTPIELPHWTRYHDLEGGGRDPLGLDRVAQRFLDRILPGITSQTQRARYYSLYAWIVDDVRRVVPRGDNSVAFVAEFQRRETALAMASLAHHEGRPEPGLAGAREAVRRYSERSVALKGGLMQERLGGFGSYYRAPMERLGLCARSETGTTLTELGARAAATFRQAIARSRFVKQDLVASEVLTYSVLKDLGAHACLCALPSTPAERDLVRGAMFTIESGLVLQYDTLCWLLELAGAGLEVEDVEKRGPHDIALRFAAYERTLPDGRSWSPTPASERIVELWRVFQANAYFSFFLETLASCIAERLCDEAPGESVAEITAWLTAAAYGPSDLAARLADDNDDERTVFETLCGDVPAVDERASLAVRGLLAGYRRNRDENGAAWHNFRALAAGELWAGTFREYVEAALQRGASFDDTLSAVVDDLILGRHLRVVYEKDRLDSLVFKQSDRRWHAEQQIRPTEPGTRLGNCVSISGDLGLVERSTFKLLPGGERVLSRRAL